VGKCPLRCVRGATGGALSRCRRRTVGFDQGTTWHFKPLTEWAHSRSFTAAVIDKFAGNNADCQIVFLREET